jgi:glyoxylase-like metal-dependent hydrolase (beta-lactamase superfamily II)
MIVDHVTVGMFQENTWLAACEETREGILIDPGDEPERIADMVERHGVTPIRIVNTHAHIDHVSAVADIKRKYGIPFAVHPGERENLESLGRHSGYFGIEPPEEPEVDHWLEEGETISFGNCELTVLATPGHTTGGVSLHGHGEIFAGDTLFDGSIGRTDLPGGDAKTLFQSIREILFVLPPETVVHCGHGPDTTIGREKLANPFVGDHASIRLTDLY